MKNELIKPIPYKKLISNQHQLKDDYQNLKKITTFTKKKGLSLSLSRNKLNFPSIPEKEEIFKNKDDVFSKLYKVNFFYKFFLGIFKI